MIDFASALADRRARVAVIGQGYVGLTLAAGAANVGFTVTGVDTDADRLARLTAGELCVPGVEPGAYHLAMDSGRLSYSADTGAAAAAAEVVVVCVPTPVIDHRPDLSAVEAVGDALAGHLTPDTLVILESTTYPGTTEQVLAPRLESGGLGVGSDILLAYSPERIDPGNTKYGLATTPRVVGGIDAASADAAATFYATMVHEVHRVSNCRAAELAKLLENTFRMVNIALVNELAMRCAEQGIDAWEVIDAAASKPFGFMPFRPGPGVGGHCIPLDPAYLAWQSRRDTGRPFRLVELAQDLNAEMPAWVATRIAEALNEHGKAVRGSRLFALGVTYKEDVGDLRESAAVRVLEELARRGAELAYHDPFVGELAVDGQSLTSHEPTDADVADADAVLLLTPHSTYDVTWLAARTRLLFDARGATRGAGDLAEHKNVEVL